MESMRYKLGIRDFLKGAILAVGVPILITIQQSLASGNFKLDWKTISVSALATFIAYIIKNFVTDDIKVAEKTLAVAKEKAAVAAEEGKK